MDKSKQPGIEFKNIILIEDNFKRDPDVPNKSKINVDFETTSNIGEEFANVEITTQLRLLHEDKEVLKHNCKFVGIFLVKKEDENMNIEDFVRNNAPALMLPYIREHITSISSKAGIKPIILPPINLIALIDNLKEQK